MAELRNGGIAEMAGEVSAEDEEEAAGVGGGVLAEWLRELDAASGGMDDLLDEPALAAARLREEERAQPRHVEGSALAAAMLAPKESPLLQELSPEPPSSVSGLELDTRTDGCVYYRRVHPAQSIRTADSSRVRFRASPWFCAEMGLPSPLSASDLVACFGTWDARPMPRLAMAYAGYQFGVLNKRLGDGRAFVWGQWRRHHQETSGRPDELWDMGTKGSGKTPFSRGHDGLLTLEGAVREAIGAEALGAAGILTSRVLTIIETEVGKYAVLRQPLLSVRSCGPRRSSAAAVSSDLCVAAFRVALRTARLVVWVTLLTLSLLVGGVLAGVNGGASRGSCCRLRWGSSCQVCAVVCAVRFVRAAAAPRPDHG